MPQPWRSHPLCGPAPLPEQFWGPERLDHAAWVEFEGRLETGREIPLLLASLEGAADILDVGGGTGLLTRAIAGRFGRCTVVEPSGENAARISATQGGTIYVIPGRAEALPVETAAFDAVLATWVLQYTDDPARSVVELARAARAAAGSRVILVQAAPTNHAVEMYNVCARVAGLPPAHHGYLLTLAAEILEGRGFDDVTIVPFPATLRFTEPELPVRIDAAASLFQRMHFAGHARAAEMRAQLRPALATRFGEGAFHLVDDGALLVARRSR